jgi:hypothetical protein
MQRTARPTRTDRLYLRAQLETADSLRAAVADRDLSPAARKREHNRIDQEAREQYLTRRKAAEQRLAAARSEAAAFTPAARRRRAILDHPERYVNLRDAFATVPDAELSAIATLAAADDDHAALAALLTAAGSRKGLSGDAARVISTAANRMNPELRTRLDDLAIGQSEFAGLIHEYASRQSDDRELASVASLALGARVIEIDGVRVTFTDADLDAMYQAADIPRATGPATLPDVVPGVVAPHPTVAA